MTKTRILRLLLLSAVALPLCMPAGAQEAAVVNDDAVSNYRVTRMVRDKKELSKVNIPQETLNDDNEAQTLAESNAIVNNEKSLTKWKFKTRNVKHASDSRHIKVVRNLAAIPEGYASITLVAGDVWGDGSGYQMLLDANATAYGSIIPATGALTTSGDVPASTYAEFEYKIPENADGALTTSNIILGGQQTILVPAGTYDWCITNPTPEDRMWIASEQGSVQGRYDNYVFEAGFSYVFTIVLNGENDDVSIDITNPDFNNPTNLTASDILDFEAMLTWTAGGDETSWNVEYKKKTDFDWISAGTATSANYLLTNLSMATEYQARVQSVYANGVSGWAITSFMTDNTAEGLCEPHDMGEISYTLSDSYGDGWNGASIQIVDAETNVVVTTLTISSGNSASGTVSLCYGRTVNFVWTDGSYAYECGFTITDPNGEVIASKTPDQTIQSTFATYTMRMPTQTESLDFGTVDVGLSKTLTAKIMNENTADVQATLTATDPFSVVSSTVMLQPGLNVISVTFTPTEATNYHSTLKVSIGGETSTVALKGTGNMSGPEAVRDEAFFEGITYTWTDSEGTHTSNLAEVATKPEQIIALLKEVYTNQDIPGNLKRGFTATGGTDTYSDVSYSGVGRISRASGGIYSYNDNLGWNIPNKTAFKNTTSNNYTFTYMDPTDYKPNVEGVTLLLVESTDDFDAEKYVWPSGTGYNYLKSMVSNTIKSVRVVTSAMRTGEGQGRGTLFKIDCDKMNKFFMLGKGQLRWVFDSYWVESSDGQYALPVGTDTACPEPCYVYRRNDNYGFNGWHDEEGTSPLFSHMFEQFSPVSLNTGANIDDLYQSLINMQSFGVYHDCLTVPFAYSSSEPEGERHGHQFMMYGLDSEAADCQDVRDLMFFVPDYRMMKDDNRDPDANYAKFVNYNTAHQPSMGLYVIRQNEITPTKQEENYYMLQLNWVTNLDDFLPSEDQEFELLQIVVNEDGIEEYVSVYYMNEDGEYTDANGNVVDEANKVPIVLQFGAGAEKKYPSVYVARQSSSQQVTYAIRGRDTGHFLSLQTSNRQSYIIPGTDPKELVSLIELSHYSRYNPDLEENCYSNRFKLSNNAGGVSKENLLQDPNAVMFTFTRKTSANDAGVDIATAKVTSIGDDGGTLQISMLNQAAMTQFPKAKSGNGYAGYHANPDNGTWTINFTYDKIGETNYVDFGDLVICDNFVVDVSNNAHSSQYIYEVNFNMNRTGEHNFDQAHGSAFRVPIYKTTSRINNWYPLDAVNGDVNRATELEDLTFEERLQYSSATEILRYDVYRWNTTEETLYIVDEVYANDTEQDLPPTGQAMNQGEYYTITMNGDKDYETNGQVSVATATSTALAPFVDKYPALEAENTQQAATYIYAPVVETFTTGKSSVGVKRTDYNTYGGPQQVTAVGVLDVKVQQPDVNSQSVGYMSTYNWTNDGKTYAYYNVPLTISKKDVPAGYGIYKIRAWREIDAQYLNEEHADVSDEIARRMDSSYPFEDITFDPNVQNPAAAMDAIDELGVTEKTLEGVTTVAKTYTTGTFGAQKVGDGAGEIAELPMKFYVRIYFTRNANLPVAQTSNAPRLKDATAADGKYYIVEKEIPFSITKNNIITAIDQLNARQVAGVKYYNVAGVESDRPFHGVNIVVTRYTDGSMTTTKVVK